MSTLGPLRDRLHALGVQETATPHPDEIHAHIDGAQLAGACARLVGEGARLVMLYGDDLGDAVRVTALLALDGALVSFDADLDAVDPRYPALTPRIPAAHWYERALHDLFGIVPEGHPWPKPLVLHEEWAGAIHPLRAAFSPQEVPAAPYSPPHLATPISCW